MRGAGRAINVVCAAVLVLFAAQTVLGLLGQEGGASPPRAARPGRLVVVAPEEGLRVQELEVSLRLDGGQRVALLLRDGLAAGEVVDEALFTEFDRAAALCLRFGWSGARSGRAELEALPIAHPSALRATGVFVEFGEDELLVRAGGQQAVYRLRGGGWERMDAA